MRVGLVTNSASRRGTGQRFAQLAFECLRAQVDVLALEGDSAREKEERVRQAARAGAIDALMAVGGDGTVHLAVEALTSTGVPLGIIPVGSGNDIAREFGLPRGSVEESVATAVGRLRAGATTSVDTIGITAGGRHRHALAILSAGLDAAINRRANCLARPGGNLRYVRAAVASMRGFQPYGLRLEIDGRAAEGPSTLVCVANTRYFGGGLCIAPEADPRDGLLDVVYVKGLPAPQIAALFPRLYTGTHLRHPHVHVRRARHVRITEAPRHGRRAPLAMADGEAVSHPPLDIRCLPGSLELLA